MVYCKNDSMSLTSRQAIPEAPGLPNQGWTKKTLIEFKSALGTIAKTFNALEAILLFEVIVTGAGELFGRRLSVGWYVILGLTLGVNVYLRISGKDGKSE